MFKIAKFYNLQTKRHFSSVKDIFLSQCLKERTILQVTGDNADAFLQGLMTNDMGHLQNGAPSMFTMFLNSSGRVKYDSIIYNGGRNKYLVECDSEAVYPLKNHFTIFKVRRSVDFTSLHNSVDVWTLVKKNNFENVSEPVDYSDILEGISQKLPQVFATIDPRLPSLGLRIITPNNISLTEELEKNLGLTVAEENHYKLLRYKLGIGEGLNELPFEKCFPMEVNGDYLHGISFQKGCYLGQELTARTYHTGVIRKRLMPLSLEEEISVSESGIPIFAVPTPENEQPIGKLQGIEKNTGVGLLRIKQALSASELLLLNTKCKTHRPFWWPSELPKEPIRQ